ncbi:MAG TPA: ribosome silencing factor [Nitrospirota bacterium]|nr:ribosome silencing factor [Nitrospirota bacterium]
MPNSLELAQLCAEAADSKKAHNIRILDLRGLTYITDYFVICSAGNITQISAIADAIGHLLASEGVRPSHIEGGAESTWVLMDYDDVVVHIFDEQTRIYYGIEKLWGDAPRVPLAFGNRELLGSPS